MDFIQPGGAVPAAVTALHELGRVEEGLRIAVDPEVVVEIEVIGGDPVGVVRLEGDVLVEEVAGILVTVVVAQSGTGSVEAGRTLAGVAVRIHLDGFQPDGSEAQPLSWISSPLGLFGLIRRGRIVPPTPRTQS